MKAIHVISSIAGAGLLLVALVVAIAWSTCRVYVPQNKCLVLIRKSGTPLPAGEKIAGPGQKGIQRDTLGPGRYFFNPLVWDWELHDLVEVSAGDPNTWKEYYAEAASDTAFPAIQGDWPQIGLLVNRVGKPAPAQDEVVEAGYQGIQREVLTPGTYRINPYVYEAKLLPATVVPLGCCGVVTSQLGAMPGVETVEDISVGPDGQPVKGHPKVIQKMAEKGQRGVLKDVLPPGIYYLNPYVYRVQIVQVGYNQISQMAYRSKTQRVGGDNVSQQRTAKPYRVGNDYENVALSNVARLDATKGTKAQQQAFAQAAGQQPQAAAQDISTQISFPSKDGFTINVDVTVVWGRHPAHIAEMINRFGDLEKLKAIILSQMRSICRNLGSEYESTDFIRGEQREQYQMAVTETLQRVCRERDIDILIALIHNIAVHGSPEAEKEGMDLKKTIQRGYIAREQDLTKQAQRETASVRAELETAKMDVEVARETISAETRKKVAEIKATGEKQAQETLAQRDLEVATIEKQIAELDAETTRLLGKAKADVEQMRNQAEADGKRLMVEAFGSGSAYNLYIFAEGFAPESIRLIFAGPGTFWTDLSRLDEAASAKLLENSTKESK
jgi:hypothetical protein